MSFGLKTTGSGVPRFGPNRRYEARSNGNRAVPMIPVWEGMCYLTRIGGKFDGAGEVARIEQRDDQWFLVVRAGCESGRGDNCTRKHITADAMCYLYNQRD